MRTEKQKLLVVDDVKDIRFFISEVAEKIGYQVFTAANSDEFKETYSAHAPDRIILDLHLEDSDGIELLHYLAEEKSQSQIMLISGVDRRTLAAARNIGEQIGLKMGSILQKPLTVETLQTALSSRLEGTEELGKEDILAALAEEQMTVFFQPQIRLQQDGNWIIDSVEALARWHHPERGLILPERFVHRAEETGLIAALTDYTIQKSLHCLKQWEKEGMKLTVALNLSGRMLADLSLPDHIEYRVKKENISAGRLVLEVTETAVMNDIKRASDILTRLRIKGFALSLDDFGTGYSSLVQLYRMPFSELKVDRSFIIDMHSNREAGVIVRSLIDLGRNLGLTVCAEGVETKKAFDTLTDLGCKKMQGFYFGKGVHAQEVIPAIKQFHGQQVVCKIKLSGM